MQTAAFANTACSRYGRTTLLVGLQDIIAAKTAMTLGLKTNEEHLQLGSPLTAPGLRPLDSLRALPSTGNRKHCDVP